LLVLAGVLLALGSAAVATAAAARPAGKGAVPKTLRIGYQFVPNGDLIVKDKGWLEKALPGTKITWTQFQSGADVNTAIVAGAIDVGLAGSSPVAKGLAPPLSIPYEVPWIFDVIGSNEALVVKSSEHVTSLAGLAGKTIATPFASTSHYSLLAALALAGVPASTVKIIDLEPQDIVAAWQRGDIDGAYVWTPFLDQLKKDGTELVNSAQLAKKGKVTADLAVVRSAFAKKFPSAVLAWLKQEDRAVKFYRSNPQAAAASIGRQLNIPASEALAESKELILLTAKQQASAPYLGKSGKPGGLARNLYSAAQFLKSQGKIDTVPPLATFQRGVVGAFASQVASG
jgi:taurine transport system substrate-binding protein